MRIRGTNGALCVGAAIVVACGSPPPPPTRAVCPASAPASEILPRVTPSERELAHWLAGDDVDRELLSVDAIVAHEATLASRDLGGRGPIALLDPIDEAAIGAVVRERLSSMEAEAREGGLVDERGERLAITALRDLAAPAELPPMHAEIRLALRAVPLRCSPRSSALSRGDPRFDRNLCSTLAPEEPVQLLLHWPNGAILARTPYVLGWVDGVEGLSPAIDEATARTLFAAPEVLAPGTDDPLPLVDGRVVRATEHGIERTPRPDGAIDVPRPLTRRAFFTTAFAHLGEAYGWGGREGHDCSSLVQHVLGTFGLHLPRNSRSQADSGTSYVDLDAHADDGTRRTAIDAAARRGIVLLTFPGHVMILLGRGDDGTPRVLHALAEYAEPCEGGGETVRLVDRVVVSDLSLGAGSSRRSLLQRITRIVIFGG